jgi:3-dehydroquinate dehydratase-2
MSSILVLNGPNLGRLGSRQPEVYGSQTLSDIQDFLTASFPADVTFRFEQTDDEAEMLGFLHMAVDQKMAVVINPAAFTHYSYALRDACAMVTEAGLLLVEVHISNPHAREEFRHRSVVSGVASGVIAGFGRDSYRLAIDYILKNRKGS